MPTRRLTNLPAKKPKSRKAMIAFLTDHFRYDTAGSWNQATSYAVKIKVGHLNLTNAETTRVYEAMELDICHGESGFNDILRQFDEDHDHRWQIGTNGRSGGYAVLYQGGKEDSGYKSRCTACGQLNFQEVKDNNNRCGRCGENARENLESVRYRIFTTPGKGLDMDKDYEEWSTDSLRARVDLVWEFGLAVEDACQAFLEWAMAHTVQEKTVMVPTRIKVAVPN